MGLASRSYIPPVPERYQRFSSLAQQRREAGEGLQIAPEKPLNSLGRQQSLHPEALTANLECNVGGGTMIPGWKEESEIGMCWLADAMGRRLPR